MSVAPDTYIEMVAVYISKVISSALQLTLLSFTEWSLIEVIHELILLVISCIFKGNANVSNCFIVL
jgi:hypothetical protein